MGAGHGGALALASAFRRVLAYVTETELEDEKLEFDSKRERTLDFQKFPHLKRTAKPDCIFPYLTDCVEMPCGCAIGAQTMFDWIKCIFDKSLDSYVIKCPVPKHKDVEWDWDLCTDVANLS